MKKLEKLANEMITLIELKSPKEEVKKTFEEYLHYVDKKYKINKMIDFKTIHYLTKLYINYNEK